MEVIYKVKCMRRTCTGQHRTGRTLGHRTVRTGVHLPLSIFGRTGRTATGQYRTARPDSGPDSGPDSDRTVTGQAGQAGQPDSQGSARALIPLECRNLKGGAR